MLSVPSAAWAAAAVRSSQRRQRGGVAPLAPRPAAAAREVLVPACSSMLRSEQRRRATLFGGIRRPRSFCSEAVWWGESGRGGGRRAGRRPGQSRCVISTTVIITFRANPSHYFDLLSPAVYHLHMTLWSRDPMLQRASIGAAAADVKAEVVVPLVVTEAAVVKSEEVSASSSLLQPGLFASSAFKSLASPRAPVPARVPALVPGRDAAGSSLLAVPSAAKRPIRRLRQVFVAPAQPPQTTRAGSSLLDLFR